VTSRRSANCAWVSPACFLSSRMRAPLTSRSCAIELSGPELRVAWKDAGVWDACGVSVGLIVSRRFGVVAACFQRRAQGDAGRCDWELSQRTTINQRRAGGPPSLNEPSGPPTNSSQRLLRIAQPRRSRGGRGTGGRKVRSLRVAGLDLGVGGPSRIVCGQIN